MRIESISRMPSDFTDFASTTLLLPDLADFFALLLLLDAFLLLLFDFLLFDLDRELFDFFDLVGETLFDFPFFPFDKDLLLLFLSFEAEGLYFFFFASACLVLALSFLPF